MSGGRCGLFVDGDRRGVSSSTRFSTQLSHQQRRRDPSATLPGTTCATPFGRLTPEPLPSGGGVRSARAAAAHTHDALLSMRWAVRLSWVANTSFCSPRRHRRTACSRTNDFCARCTAGHTSGNSTGWGSSPRSSICVEKGVKRLSAQAGCVSANLCCLLERDQVALHQWGKSEEHTAEEDEEVAVVRLPRSAARESAPHTSAWRS